MSALAKRKHRRIVSVVPVILLFVILSTFSFPAHHSSVGATQLPPTGIAWVTKPLQQVYNLIQSRFIGLIPGNYTEPSSSDYSTMSKIFGLIGTGISQNDAGPILTASNVAVQLNYQLIPLNDSVTGDKYYVLMENPAVNRGWGSYLFSAETSPSTTPVVIEAPHPVTDFNSQQIAYTIFTSAYPHVTALLVSGVERTLGPNGQTDMAHRTQSIFETAHEALTKFGSVAIQIHGFDASHHPTEPLVVLSDGDGGINGALQSIASNLEAANLSVGIFDGFTHEKLGAQKNIQGRYARTFGIGFVHSEISSIVVYNATLIVQYENALTQSILDNFSFPAYQIDLKIPIIAAGIMSLFLLASYRFSKTKLN
ncbi:MAG TPA: hypothetical protein VNA15_04140 [Candidatus Angelobacter sp.]|nr:hypothetical protein [Candidatus Angelobacter sp.]